VFAKGGDFIPVDMVYSQITRENYEVAIDRAIENNFNALRVWGGGLYEWDDFYDLCDEKGIIVWQDFIGACATYPAFEKDLRWMQKNGVKLARYTNRTSWAERDVRLAGRMDLWDVMINDRMDGYQVWTAGVTGQWLGYRYAYSSASRIPVHNYPPEKQSICQLVYVRKKGDFFKAISCIRLEDMRDGITDYLYYKEAEKALKARKDPNWEAKLAAVAKMPKKRPADYLAVRNALIKLILP
jgi:hypothetical protein